MIRIFALPPGTKFLHPKTGMECLVLQNRPFHISPHSRVVPFVVIQTGRWGFFKNETMVELPTRVERSLD